MRTKDFLLVLACLVALAVAGCVSTVDGRHKAGLPFAKDRIGGLYDRPPADVWEAAKNTLQALGTLTSEDVVRLSLEANVDTRNVWIKVEPREDKTTQLTVQCRTKGGAADRDLAAYLDKQIAIRLASGNLRPSSAMPPSR